MFRGPHIVEGGARAEARGILTTRREIKELRERAEAEGAAVERLRERHRVARRHDRVRRVRHPVAAGRAAPPGKVDRRFRAPGRQRGGDRRADHPQAGADRDRAPIRGRGAPGAGSPAGRSAGIDRADRGGAAHGRRPAEHGAAPAVRGARGDAGAGAAHVRSQGRARRARRACRARSAIEVQRLEESAARARNARAQTRRDDLQRAQSRRTALLESITASESTLDAGVRAFDELRDRVRTADEASQTLRTAFEEQEGRIREARRTLEAVRAEAAQLDVDAGHRRGRPDAPGRVVPRVRAGHARRGCRGSRRARARRTAGQPEAGGRCARRRGDRGRSRRAVVEPPRRSRDRRSRAR